MPQRNLKLRAKKTLIGVLTSLVLLSVGSLLIAQISCDQTPGPDDTHSKAKFPDSKSLQKLNIESEAVASKHPKLESSLASVVEVGKSSTAEALKRAQMLGMRVSGNLIQVYIVTHPEGVENAIRAVNRTGGRVARISSDQTLIQAWVSVNALETLANDSDVYFIRQPDMAGGPSDGQ